VRNVEARRLPPLWCENRISGSGSAAPRAGSGYHTSTGNSRLRAVSVACKLRSATAGWGGEGWTIVHGIPVPNSRASNQGGCRIGCRALLVPPAPNGANEIVPRVGTRAAALDSLDQEPNPARTQMIRIRNRHPGTQDSIAGEWNEDDTFKSPRPPSLEPA